MNQDHGDFPHDPDGDWLDALLSQARPEEIGDDGFSGRVMQRILPQPMSAQTHAIHARVVDRGRHTVRATVAGAVAGVLLTVANAPWPAFSGWGAALSAPPPMPAMPAMIAFALAMLGVGAVAFAIQDE